MNAFNLLEKKNKRRQLMQLCIWEKRSDNKKKKNGRGKKVKNEGMKLWRERNRKREEEKWKVVLECNKII